MEGFNFDVEKASGFRQMKNLFRTIEILIVLAFTTWALSRLPLAVRISGEYLRQAANLVVGHLFVFFVANIIVLILFFFLHNELRDISEATTAELCLRFVEDSCAPQPEEEEEEVVFHDKETILEGNKLVVGVHRRSQSANFRRESAKELRRSETERRRRVEQSSEEFQRSIEEFIAKQVKFHRQEKLAIVLHG